MLRYIEIFDISRCCLVASDWHGSLAVGLLLQIQYSVVCRSVCLSVTTKSLAKRTDPIEMPFGCGLWGPEELCITFWGYKFNSDYMFTRLGTRRTCCPVPLRYNAWLFGGINPFILGTPLPQQILARTRHARCFSEPASESLLLVFISS